MIGAVCSDDGQDGVRFPPSSVLLLICRTRRLAGSRRLPLLPELAHTRTGSPAAATRAGVAGEYALCEAIGTHR